MSKLSIDVRNDNLTVAAMRRELAKILSALKGDRKVQRFSFTAVLPDDLPNFPKGD